MKDDHHLPCITQYTSCFVSLPLHSPAVYTYSPNLPIYLLPSVCTLHVPRHRSLCFCPLSSILFILFPCIFFPSI